MNKDPDMAEGLWDFGSPAEGEDAGLWRTSPDNLVFVGAERLVPGGARQ